MLRRIGTFLLGLISALRTGWDILGATLLLLMVVLGVWAVGGRVAGMLAPARQPGPPHPYAAQPWFPSYQSEFLLGRRSRWSPYVHWRRAAFQGRYTTVDSAGYRVTPQVATRPVTRQVLFLGGSTMWGSWQRDSMTIPATVLKLLAAKGYEDVGGRNLGEAGFVSTQELLELTLALRSGERPRVVVFYDGINDVVASVQNRVCGLPENEPNRRFEFAMGRLTLRRDRTELRDALSAIRTRFFTEDPLSIAPDDAEARRLGEMTARCYLATIRIAEGLGREYGFTPIFFWQPMIGTSRKPATPFEARFPQRGFPLAYRRVEQYATASLQTLLGAADQWKPANFHEISGLYCGATESVWIDPVGHTTEGAAARVAATMAPIVAAALDGRPEQARAVSAPACSGL